MASIAAVAPLKRRDFRYFWFGQWVSQFGDNIFHVAQVWIVYQLTGSAGAMATVALCGQIPSIAMILMGGALVDRLPRRRVALWSDLVRGALVLAAAGLLYAGALGPWHMYALAAAFGTVSAFARPAFRALIPTLVPPEERTATNSLISAGSTAAGIAGPTLGGLIMAAGGAEAAFLVNGLSFLAAGAGLLLTRVEEPARTHSADAAVRPAHLVRDLLEALRVLAAQPFLLATIIFMAIINVTGQAPEVILRPWVARELAGGGPGTLSLTYTCFSAGMFGALTLLGSWKIKRHRGLWAYGGILVTGFSMVGMALVTAPWQLWVLDFVLGAACMTYFVIWEGMLQDLVPAEVMGRVAAIDEFGRMILYPLGLAAVGLLASSGAAFWAMLGGGLLTVLLSLAGLMMPVVRRQG